MKNLFLKLTFPSFLLVIMRWIRDGPIDTIREWKKFARWLKSEKKNAHKTQRKNNLHTKRVISKTIAYKMHV